MHSIIQFSIPPCSSPLHIHNFSLHWFRFHLIFFHSIPCLHALGASVWDLTLFIHIFFSSHFIDQTSPSYSFIVWQSFIVLIISNWSRFIHFSFPIPHQSTIQTIRAHTKAISNRRPYQRLIRIIHDSHLNLLLVVASDSGFHDSIYFLPFFRWWNDIILNVIEFRRCWKKRGSSSVSENFSFQ